MNTLENLRSAAYILANYNVKAVKVNTDRLTFQVSTESGPGYIILDALLDESLESPVLVAEIVMPPGWDSNAEWYSEHK